MYKNTPFAISQKDLLLSIFLHLCQSHVWEMMPCYYLICFPLITSEAVNLFSSAICLSSTNYLLMSWFVFIWGYLSLFCWFIRLLYIVHVSISYIGNRYFFPTYILKCLVYGLFCHLKVWCIQMYLLFLLLHFVPLCILLYFIHLWFTFMVGSSKHLKPVKHTWKFLCFHFRQNIWREC